MDKEEADRLSEELWELSEDVDKNIERMKEIAKILTQYYLDQWNKNPPKSQNWL